MKRLAYWIVGGVVALGPAAASYAVDQKPMTPAQQQPGPGAMDASQEAMMAKMKEAGSPSEGHARLEPLVGTWRNSAMWWMSPGAAPEISQGTNENTWILGGRFVRSNFSGQAMGQPFEGIGIIGYDNIRHEYSSVWLDNMSTGMMTSTAQYDPATNTLKELGSFSCPMTGEAQRKFRATWTFIDPAHYKYEMYTLDKDGTEFKSMEIVYERQ